jgi:hypothetical protein
MQLFQRWHPEVRMRTQLLVKPAGARFLRAHAKKIGASGGYWRLCLIHIEHASICAFIRRADHKIKSGRSKWNSTGLIRPAQTPQRCHPDPAKAGEGPHIKTLWHASDAVCDPTVFARSFGRLRDLRMTRRYVFEGTRSLSAVSGGVVNSISRRILSATGSNHYYITFRLLLSSCA